MKDSLPEGSLLTFIKVSHHKVTPLKSGKKKHERWDWYKCSCGNLILRRRGSVKRGAIKSCGCLRKKLSAERLQKIKDKPEYKPPSNLGNRLGGGAKKGNTPSNKGKILIRNNPPGHKYITWEELENNYWGITG